MSEADYYSTIFSSYKQKRVLVIGDTILDVYLNGKTTRLCPEAPVPLVDIEERLVFLGGAANTACNFRSLGAEVDFVSVVGDDASGNEALELLEEKGISSRFGFKSGDRHTLVKTRLVSGGHIVSRFDSGSTTAISDEINLNICKLLTELHGKYDAIVLSDYDKGVITEALTSCLERLQIESNIYLAIDSKRLQFFSNLKPSFVKPNYNETISLLGHSSRLKNRADQLKDEGERLFAITKSNTIAVTLDAEGSLLFYNGNFVAHIPAEKIHQPSVSGAGDTYLAAFVLSDCSETDTAKNAKVATAAASIAIAKEFTSTCSRSELEEHFRTKTRKIISQTELHDLCQSYRSEGKKIVFTNGCFDILHSGHVTYLQCARDFGDVLIIGINTDESIKRIKGESRPINSLDDRMQVLEGLTCVTHLVPFGSEEDDTPVPLINIIKPEIFVKGGDYSKETLPEASTVEMHGGTIHFIPQVPNHSTTQIIKKINGNGISRKRHGELERL